METILLWIQIRLPMNLWELFVQTATGQSPEVANFITLDKNLPLLNSFNVYF